jgi:hypothetical protein
MPRRTKLLITTTLLVLLATPAAYVALTWHVADPFRFRYVGHGEVEMMDNYFDPDAPKWPTVPIFIEVQNTTNFPILLMDGEVRGERDRASPMPCIDLDADGEPIPRRGTIRLEEYVDPEVIERLEHEALEVSYESLSGTQIKACGLLLWAGEQLHQHFHIDIITGFNINTNKSVTPLLKDPAHLPQPSPSKTTTSSP